MSPDAAVLLGVVAAILLVLKCLILFTVRVRDRVSKAFVALCLFFACQNAIEFLGYFSHLNSIALSEVFLHLYMVTLFFVVPSFLVLPLALADSPWFIRVRGICYCIAVLTMLAYLGGYVVEDYVFLDWTAVARPGPLYWVVMGYNLACCVGYLLVLVQQSYTNPDYQVRHNTRVTLVATTPIIAVAVAVLSLRLLGFDSSSALSLPLATLLFLYIMLVHTQGNLFWLSTKVKALLLLMRMDHRVPAEELVSELEKMRIQEALKLTGGQQNNAAQVLGVPASTLSKRISKYRIDADNYRP
jgi:energy-converting hydrogenase Eha subunit A